MNRVVLASSAITLVLILLPTPQTPLAAGGGKVLYDVYHSSLDPSQFGILAEQIQFLGFSLTLADADLSSIDLSEYSLIIIACPYRPLDPAEVETLVNYTMQGGSILILGSPEYSEYINPLSEAFGVLFTNLVVVDGDGSEVILGYPSGDPASGVRPVMLVNASRLLLRPPARPVLNSSPTSWVDTIPDGLKEVEEVSGPLPLAAASSLGLGRAIFISSASLLSDNLIWGLDNREFALCLLEWLLEAPLAKASIGRARVELQQARGEGVDTSIAETLLSRAEESLQSGDYGRSLALSRLCLQILNLSRSLREAERYVSEAASLLASEEARGRDHPSESQRLQEIMNSLLGVRETLSELTAEIVIDPADEYSASIEALTAEVRSLASEARSIAETLRSAAWLAAESAVSEAFSTLTRLNLTVREAGEYGARVDDLRSECDYLWECLVCANSSFADPYALEDAAKKIRSRAELLLAEAERRRDGAKVAQEAISQASSALALASLRVERAKWLMVETAPFEEKLSQASDLLGEARAELEANKFESARLTAEEARRVSEGVAAELEKAIKLRTAVIALFACLLVAVSAVAVLALRRGRTVPEEATEVAGGVPARPLPPAKPLPPDLRSKLEEAKRVAEEAEMALKASLYGKEEAPKLLREGAELVEQLWAQGKREECARLLEKLERATKEVFEEVRRELESAYEESWLPKLREALSSHPEGVKIPISDLSEIPADALRWVLSGRAQRDIPRLRTDGEFVWLEPESPRQERPRTLETPASIAQAADRLRRAALSAAVESLEAGRCDRATVNLSGLLDDFDESIRREALRSFEDEMLERYDIRCFIRGSTLVLEGDLRELLVDEVKRELTWKDSERSA